MYTYLYSLCRLSLLLYSRLNRPCQRSLSLRYCCITDIIMQNEAEASIPTEAAVREGPRQNLSHSYSAPQSCKAIEMVPRDCGAPLPTPREEAALRNLLYLLVKLSRRGATSSTSASAPAIPLTLIPAGSTLHRIPRQTKLPAIEDARHS
jgi:hypothetical protein